MKINVVKYHEEYKEGEQEVDDARGNYLVRVGVAKEVKKEKSEHKEKEEKVEHKDKDEKAEHKDKKDKVEHVKHTPKHEK